MKITVYVYCGEYEDKIVSLKKEDLIPALLAEDDDLSFATWLANQANYDPDGFAEDFIDDPDVFLQSCRKKWCSDVVKELDEILSEGRRYSLGDKFFSYELDLPCNACPKSVLEIAFEQFGGIEGLLKTILS